MNIELVERLENMKNVVAELRIALLAVSALAVMLCGFYPLAVWALSQGLFPDKANGSLILGKQMIRGSRLIAQGFGRAEILSSPTLRRRARL